LAIVRKFHAQQAHVYVLDKNEVLLEAVRNELPNVTTICVDLLDWESTRKTIAGLKPIHHLINNAGILRAAPFMEISEKDFDL